MVPRYAMALCRVVCSVLKFFFCIFKKKIVGSILRVLCVCESFLIVVFGGYAIEHCDEADRLGWSRFMHKRIKRALGRPDSLTHPEPGGDSAAAYRCVGHNKVN